ncbi:hypothetical protein GBAR_LOCUS7442 [Geodia barretti]|uniref:Uncharacterized protein n=1 Tax=Geodia barretti TaxID=519541 RepID=A0AA35RK44_GEOBA|nr:hypothetical protein GBAR_LOCUS7442 [Geodia barretti]
MAKKKGRRSINVARKREKRNRDRKFRQKQLAVEKQRRLPYEKSEEEHLHACISQSRKLLNEPELEGVLFDFELMYTRVTEVLDNYQADKTNALTAEFEEDLIHLTNVTEEATSEEELNPLPEAERACEHFRLEVLPHLVTPDFMQQLVQALTACEKRLKLIGNRELAEVAFVTRSLFEAAPSEILAFHPMIQTIGIETLRILVEEPDMIIDRREEVKEILSDVLEYKESEAYQSQPISVFSDTAKNQEHHKEKDTESNLTEPASPHFDTVNTAITDPAPLSDPVDLSGTPTSEIAIPPVSPDELPARALYKNFNGLAIKESFEERTDDPSLQEGLANYALVNESEEQVEFVDVENERYITVTEERLQLHARSEAELTIAMAEIEAQCTSAVMYLAKTIEERG